MFAAVKENPKGITSHVEGVTFMSAVNQRDT